MINKRFKEYFTFTRRERNGIIVLLFILFILVFINTYLNNKSFGEIIVIDEEFQKDIELFEESLVLKKRIESKTKYANNRKVKKEIEVWKIPETPFQFNPNNATEKELKMLGFSSSQIKTLLNYRNKGGAFYKKKDLLKIYGIKERQYKYLESYINIQNKLHKTDSSVAIVKRTLIQVEINSSTSEDLMSLKGIGESFAGRIIKYRELLGGFVRKDQLLEIYGMDSSRYLQFEKRIVVDTNLIVKMNINKVKFKTLLKHPYLNKYQTQSIMKYREISGKFTQIEQILENKLLLKDDYLRIKPYLLIEDL